MEKKTKTILAVIIVAIVAVSALFFYVFILNEEVEKKPATLKSMALTLDDLPEGYEISDETIQDSDDFPVETYWVSFIYNKSENPENHSEINLGLSRFNNISKAVVALEDQMLYIYAHDDIYNITEISEEIGEKVYFFYINRSVVDKNDTNISKVIYFRISNIICSLSGYDSDEFLIDLAKIVEQRIYDSLN